jgi:uncharacterized membrane protein YfcA
MNELLGFLIGIGILILGIPIGNYLAKVTKEELKPGRLWLKLIIIISFIGAVIFLILGNDALLFALLFIAIVTSRSLRTKKGEKRSKKKRKSR